MIEWPFDPRIGLALAIWGLALSRGLRFLPLGQGVLSLRRGRVIFPSVRAVFARRWALILGPLALWWPTVRVDIFGSAPAPDAAWDAAPLARRFRRARVLVMVEALLILVLLPVGLLLRAPDDMLIAVALAAYLLYALIALRLLWGGREALSLVPQRRIVLEPLLCLPYMPFVLAQVCQGQSIVLPLTQALERYPAQPESARLAISAYLEGVAEMMDDPAAHGQIAALQNQLATLA